MGAAMIGYVVGMAVGSLVLPILLLILTRFVPAMRRHPTIVYGVCLALVLFVFIAAAARADSLGPVIVAALLALLFLGWDYIRNVKALAAASSSAPPPTSQQD
jgi:predicted tellurium resistance membrane protein TerC